MVIGGFVFVTEELQEYEGYVHFITGIIVDFSITGVLSYIYFLSTLLYDLPSILDLFRVPVTSFS